MSYFFEFVEPNAPVAREAPKHEWFLGGKASYEMNAGEMSMMVEVMREAGALKEQGMGPDWKIQEVGVTHDKFRSNSNWHVTPEECRLIADKMRAAIDSGGAGTVLSFFDDAPPFKESGRWLESWTEFNARASMAGGYMVR